MGLKRNSLLFKSCCCSTEGRSKLAAAVAQCRRRKYSTEKSVQLPAESFKLYGDLDTSPPLTVSITKEDALKYYYQMQLIRRMETAASQLYQEKMIRGFCHLYNGEEACGTGLNAVLKPTDSLITAYRCHGLCWLRGIQVVHILSELFGSDAGCSRGKGGSMHMYAKAFYGGNGIVGAQVPLGTGVALAHQYRKDGGICATLYGDGAANQGQVFESFNMACLWKLPVLYVCENNQFGMGTSAQRSSCLADYYKRGHYIPGIWVNGMDVLAVVSAIRVAAEYARSKGPIVVELNTYRYFGHSMSDPGVSYRSREEVQSMRDKHDPIMTYKAVGIANELFTETETKEIDNRAKNEVTEAVTKAKSSKEVDIKELTGDVYSQDLMGLIRDNVNFLPHQHFRQPSQPSK